jgi:hypothetical protein
MSKRTSTALAALLGTAALAIGAVPAMAGSPNHSEEPVPGTKSCHGQAMAFLAQSELGPGIGNVAGNSGHTVKEVQAIVDEFCAA